MTSMTRSESEIQFRAIRERKHDAQHTCCDHHTRRSRPHVPLCPVLHPQTLPRPHVARPSRPSPPPSLRTLKALQLGLIACKSAQLGCKLRQILRGSTDLDFSFIISLKIDATRCRTHTSSITCERPRFRATRARRPVALGRRGAPHRLRRFWSGAGCRARAGRRRRCSD